MSIHTHTFKKQDGHLVLYKDKEEVYCPFVAPIASQTPMGQLQLLRLPCTTQCPHLEMSGTQDIAHMSCGSEIKSIKIVKEIKENLTIHLPGSHG